MFKNIKYERKKKTELELYSLTTTFCCTAMEALRERH